MRRALVQRFGWGQLAPGLTLRRIAGGAALSGIGFTISLFIIDIAIHDPLRQDEARVGVLLASLSAFLLGWAIFRVTDWLSPPEPVGLKLVRPVDPDRDHVRGNPDAPLTLVEYGDFECPFCSRATGSIDQVRAHFGDKLRYVWRHLPLERVHPRALDAARASEAAALQGKFWEMARELFDHPDDLEWSDIYRYAVAAGCDIERFDKDVRVHASKVLHRVQDDAQDAELMDLSSTPTFFVNGKRHKGPWDAASLIRAGSRPTRWIGHSRRQLHSVTCTFGRNRVTPTPVPRNIACVQRGVVMKRTSSETAGWRAAGANVIAHHSPGA